MHAAAAGGARTAGGKSPYVSRLALKKPTQHGTAAAAAAPPAAAGMLQQTRKRTSRASAADDDDSGDTDDFYDAGPTPGAAADASELHVGACVLR
jgi:hypothetical protein